MEELDQLQALMQENENLKKQKEELEKTIKALEVKQTNEELEQLRKKVLIEEMVAEARQKLYTGVLSVVTLLGIASFAGILNIYQAARTTIVSKLQEPESLKVIETQVTEKVTPILVENFKKDKQFKQTLAKLVTDQVSNQILKDPALSSQVYSIATTTVNATIKKVAQEDPNSNFSIAANEVLGQSKYFVLAASSTERNDLVVTKNKPENLRLSLKSKICDPIIGNQRFVLIVTSSSSPVFQLPIDAAQQVLQSAKQIDKTAYILPVEPSANIFFDPNRCE